MRILQAKKTVEPVFLNDLYLKGVLRELLAGESMDFHARLYDEDFLKERLRELISEESYELAKRYWQEVKQVFGKRKTDAPFIYFDTNKNWFTLCADTNSEDKLLSILEDDEEQIVIFPSSFERWIDKEKSEDYVHYRTASLLANYVIERTNL